MIDAARLPVVVLVSGRGSNLHALIDAQTRNELGGGHIRAVISNRPNAYALERARRAGIEAEVVDHKAFPEREDFDRELMERIGVYQPGLIAMAGFMRLLTPDFTARYDGHMLNIHPSLLPDFRGLNTHARALAAGAKQHGCSVHFVGEGLDTGPVIMQAKVHVLPDDDEEKLAARVLAREHIIYPMAVRWFCEGRLAKVGDAACLDGAPISKPIVLDEDEL